MGEKDVKNSAGQMLTTVAAQARVAGAVHLTPPARASRVTISSGSETGVGPEGHYRKPSTRCNWDSVCRWE